MMEFCTNYGVWRIRFFAKMPRPSHGRAAREGGLLGLKQQRFVTFDESELLPGLHPSRIPVHGTPDFSFFSEILQGMFIVAIAFNIAINIVCL
jgi:hypothetical protein